MAVAHSPEFTQVSFPIHQRRQKSVLVIEEGKLQINVTFEGFKAEAGIIAIIIEHALADAVAET